MATQYSYATSKLESGSWYRTGGSSDINAINTDDGDTSFWAIADTSGYDFLCWAVDDLPASAVAVNSVTQSFKARRSGTAGATLSYGEHVGSTNYVDSYTGGLTTVYVLYSHALGYLPGGGWTVSNFNSCGFGSRWSGTGGSGTTNYRITLQYITVDYTPGGGCVVAAWSHLLPLVGALTSLADLQKFLSFVDVRKYSRVVYTRQELESIRENLRKLQRGYVFMGNGNGRLAVS